MQPGDYDPVEPVEEKLKDARSHTDPQFAAEGTFYGADAQYSSYVVPDSGHSVNVTESAPRFFEETFRWLHARGLAPDEGPGRSARCVAVPDGSAAQVPRVAYCHPEHDCP